MIRGYLLTVLIGFTGLFAHGQFPPPAGQPGTTAMYKDSSAFRSWAGSCEVEIGYINFVDTTVTFLGSNKAAYGFPEDATGKANNFVVSLGDRGMATLTFSELICDNPGPDFAVFENSFNDEFLELAFVEVSSDGQRFVRFPSVSLTPESPQVATFGTIDATHIHNLAGKYRVEFGTPFDLSDLSDSSGIDLQAITHIRIRDVGGCIEPGYQSFDSEGHIINDPWPTPFNTCGFDLDAVGVIHAPQTIYDQSQIDPIRIYPNPVEHILRIQKFGASPIMLNLRDAYGRLYYSDRLVYPINEIDISTYPAGIYFAIFTLRDGSRFSRKIVKH